uniref:Chitinase n=1 Tax=Pinctada fucata TaxID=50426 RepID=A0A194AMZ5_PINFU
MKGMYERFNKLKQQNPSLKTLLAVGGWNMGSAPFTRMVASDASRRDFATDTVKFLRTHGFDGLDLDWEYPANRGSPAGDRDKFTELLKVLKSEFAKEAQSTGNPQLLLSAAIPAGQSNIDTGYNVPEISKYLDLMNLMTYDLHGGSFEDETGHNSPLHQSPLDKGNNTHLNVEWAAHYWVSKGAPKSKLNIGMPLYGRSFTLADPNNDGLYAPDRGNGGQAGRYTREAGFLSYYEICEMLKSGGTRHYLPDAMVPYVVKGNQWVGYDDPDSLKQKVDFVKKEGYGGIMVWALDLDDFSGSCGQGKYPLLRAINNELKSSGTAPITPVPTTLPKPVTQKTTLPRQTAGPIVTNAPPVTPQPTAAPQPTGAPQPTNPQLTNPQPTNPQPVQTTHHIGLTQKFNCNGRTSGFYPDPNSCTSYYICAGATSFEVTCASGLNFNPKTKYCDWPNNVQCNNKPNPTQAPAVPQTTVKQTQMTQRLTQGMTQTTTSQSSPPVQTYPAIGTGANAFCSSRSDGHYRDPQDCGMFYQCASGLGFHEPCPPGTAFNEGLVACDYPYKIAACRSYTGRK